MFRRTFSLFFQSIALELGLCAVPVLAGWALFDLRGAIGGWVVGTAGAIAVAWTAERSFLAGLGGYSPASPGILRLLPGAFDVDGKLPFHVTVYQDPMPKADVVRSLGTGGAITLSQGLVSSCSEAELRDLLLFCVARLDDPGIVPQTMARAFLGLLPEEGRQTRLSSPGRAVLSLVLLPIQRFLSRLSAPTRIYPRRSD